MNFMMALQRNIRVNLPETIMFSHRETLQEKRMTSVEEYIILRLDQGMNVNRTGVALTPFPSITCGEVIRFH
jgi:hypothetical protein